MRVYLIASKVTDSVVYGFLPAAVERSIRAFRAAACWDIAP